MRRSLSVLASSLVALVALGTLPSCTVAKIGARSLGSFFSSPRKVAKVQNPVRRDARLSVLWIGHATALIQIDDKIILTDPVFTSSVGQLSRRTVEPGLDVENLPPVDAVLISHMHFDHLSLGSLDMIEDRVKNLFLPRGGLSYLTDFRFPALELGRWQNWEKDGLRVTAVPVAHVGHRYGIDDEWMKSSFTGYVVEYHGIKVYFGGDTAYDQKLFVETAQRIPGIDLALLPIGPAEPRDFMRRVHVDPNEALQAFIDLKAKRMVPIHYDTFINGGDTPGEPSLNLMRAANAMNLGTHRIVQPLAIGEQRVFWKTGQPDPLAGSIDSAQPPPPPPGTKPPSAEPAKKDDIPDDDKLD